MSRTVKITRVIRFTEDEKENLQATIWDVCDEESVPDKAVCIMPLVTMGWEVERKLARKVFVSTLLHGCDNRDVDTPVYEMSDNLKQEFVRILAPAHPRDEKPPHKTTGD